MPADAQSQPPSTRRTVGPFVHGALYAIGVQLVSFFGQLVFLGNFIRDRIGPAAARELAEDPEQVMSLMGELPTEDLLLIVVAGQGLALIYTFMMWRALRNGRFVHLGLPDGAVAFRGLGLGALQGAALIAAVVGMGVAVGALGFQGWEASPELLVGGAAGGASVLGLLLISAFAEEVFFRGYMFRIMLESGNVLAALVACTLFFGLFHGSNPGAGPLGVVGTAAAGLLFALVALKDGHLWRAVGLHWGWNLTMGYVASLPVSGLKMRGLVQWAGDTPDPFWLGGDFGPEGGALGVAVLVASVVVTALQIREEGVVLPTPPPPPEPMQNDNDTEE